MTPAPREAREAVAWDMTRAAKHAPFGAIEIRRATSAESRDILLAEGWTVQTAYTVSMLAAWHAAIDAMDAALPQTVTVIPFGKSIDLAQCEYVLKADMKNAMTMMRLAFCKARDFTESDAYAASLVAAERESALAKVEAMRKPYPEHHDHCLLMSTSDISLSIRCTCGVEGTILHLVAHNAVLDAVRAVLGETK